MAPEVIKQKKKGDGYDSKSDIWSLGITLIEFAEGKPPLFDIASLRVIFLIPAREPPTFKETEKWSKDFIDFVSSCLQKDPDKRPTSEELLQHPFCQKGASQEYSPILKILVQDSLPALKELREKKKNRGKGQTRVGDSNKNQQQEESDEDDSDSDNEEEGEEKFKKGDKFTINAHTKEWSHTTSYDTTVINEEDEEGENSTATTKIHHVDIDDDD